MPKWGVSVNDGQEMEIEAATPDEAIRKAHTQVQLQKRAAPATTGAPTGTGAPFAPPGVMDGSGPTAPPDDQGGGFTSGLMSAARVVGHMIPPSPTAIYDPYKALRGQPQGGTLPERITASQADIARSAPSLIPNPLIASGASGAGEIVAQALEGKQQPDYLQAGIAAAIPPIAAGVAAIPGALSRTATRVLPGRFAAAHEAAQEAGQGLVQSLEPGVGREAAQYGLARTAMEAGETVPLATTERLITGRVTLPSPASGGTSAAQNAAANLQNFIKPDGSIGLAELDAIRRDIGQAMRSKAASPELGALYNGIVQDLKASAASGGAGAAAERAGAELHRQALGAALVDDALTKATQFRSTAGADVPVLNMGRFGQELYKRKDDLAPLIGPQGMQLLQDFIIQNRTLPPKMALDGVSALGHALASVGGTVIGTASGGLLGGAIGAGVAPIGLEFVKNLLAVSRDPRLAAQVLAATAQGVRSGSVPGQGGPQ